MPVNRTPQEIVEALAGRLNCREPVSLFNPRSMDRLTRSMAGSAARQEQQGGRDRVRAAEDRRILLNKVKRSKNPNLKKMFKRMEDDLWGDDSNVNSYPSPLHLYNPHSFLLWTPHGKKLREIMLDETDIANRTIYRIVRAGLTLGMRGNTDVTITKPYHAYLDHRKQIIERLESKRSVTQLIQKQERLLQRIGTTIDMGLGSDGMIGEEAGPALELFRTLWSCHVTEMGKNSVSVKMTAPAILTIQMLEVLTAYCDPYWLAAQIAEGARIKDQILELYPAKVLVQETKQNGNKTVQGAFFN